MCIKIYSHFYSFEHSLARYFSNENTHMVLEAEPKNKKSKRDTNGAAFDDGSGDSKMKTIERQLTYTRNVYVYEK